MFKTIQLSNNFTFGTATAAYQIEGAWNKDQKGESIWDRFTHDNNWAENGDTACDHYHLFEEDITLMASMGIQSYRFSIAWTRIFPNDDANPNQKGINFYHSIIDTLDKFNIKPLVTIYHWDLPQYLQEKGGWNNKNTVDEYLKYAQFLFHEFGKKVEEWITFNEPFIAAFAGHAVGVHAPGIKDFKTAVNVSYHLLLANAKAIQLYRKKHHGKIGITCNVSPCYPENNSNESVQNTTLVDGIINRWFLEPILKGSFPEDILPIYEQFLDWKLPKSDLELFQKTRPDFIGINYYSRKNIGEFEGGFNLNALYSLFLPSSKENTELTDMGWEVYPEGLNDVLTDLKSKYGDIEIKITENGAAYQDEIRNGEINDIQRISYIERHFEQIGKLLKDGVNISAYYLWSFLDNFEWAEGYSKRFGIVHVDYKTQKRTPKESAKYYQSIIQYNLENSLQES